MDTKRWVLLGVCVASFMLLVDITIVNVALPSVQRDLGASLLGLQWVVDAYAVALAALTLAAGSVADRFGRRRIFALGVAAFTGASLLCALSPGIAFLDAARALQGIGGAAMFATSLALLAQEFHGRERAAAFAFWGATVGGAVAVGPLAGGMLTQGLGWRWIFFVNIPFGLVTLSIALSRMSQDHGLGARGLDTPGLLTFSGALFLGTFGLLRGNADGWSSKLIVGALAGAAVLLVVFTIVERHRDQAMFDLSLFRRPAFAGVSFAMLGLAAGMFANIFFISLYLQDVLRYSPLQAGLRLLPCTLMVFVVPLAARGAAKRVSPRVHIAAGMTLVAAGLFDMHLVGPASRWTGLLPGMVLAGVGIGLANPAIAAAALGVVEPQRTGMASGISNTFRLGGLALGIAALGAVFQHEVSRVLGSSHVAIASAVASAGVRAVAQNPATEALARSAFVAGTDVALLIGAVVNLLGAAIAAVLVRDQDFVEQRQSQHAPTESASATR